MLALAHLQCMIRLFTLLQMQPIALLFDALQRKHSVCILCGEPLVHRPKSSIQVAIAGEHSLVGVECKEFSKEREPFNCEKWIKVDCECEMR